MELDSLFFAYLLDSKNVIGDNSTNPTYISEYINIIGQLFLAGYIEFGMCGLQDKEENLLSNQGDKYQLGYILEIISFILMRTIEM